MNMLRVWGGGIYEYEDFYDACDELGILVWQDFMFACSLYPVDGEFLDSVRQEAKHQLRRLKGRACIALWCGNNENEQALGWNSDGGKDRLQYERAKRDYVRLYIDTVAAVVREEDPERSYWPSSPSNGTGRWGDPNDERYGDAHYWEVWHGGKSFDSYREGE